MTATATPQSSLETPNLGYFGWLRHDVLAHVPQNARHVLSVGCASGLTEAELVKRGATVVGLEMDPTAARIARDRGIIVHEGDAQSLGDALQGQRFDCLIYADILEHLSDPFSLLQQHVTQLLPGGTVIISVPNFRHALV